MLSRNAFVSRIYLVVIIFLPSFGYAQSLNITQIKKIVLKHKTISRTTITSETYNIIRTENAWYSSRSANRQANFSSGIVADTVDRKFSAKIDDQIIIALLEALNHPKTQFVPQDIGITAEFLKRNADSLFSQTLSMLTSDKVAQFKNYITDENIKKVCEPDLLFPNLAMDYGEVWEIDIVKNDMNNIKLHSYTFYDFILPWQIDNKEDCYNISIADFSAKARGINLFENGSFVDLKFFCEQFYTWLYNAYCEAFFKIGQFSNSFLYPDNAMLTIDFDITNLRTDEDNNATDPILSIDLHAKEFPQNIVFKTSFHLSTDIEKRMFRYGRDIELALRQKNFVFDYVTQAPDLLLTFQALDTIENFKATQLKYPCLTAFSEAQVKKFYITNKKDDSFSTWYLLPNSQLFLINLKGKKLLNVPSGEITTKDFSTKLTDAGILFDKNGKILRNF